VPVRKKERKKAEAEDRSLGLCCFASSQLDKTDKKEKKGGQGRRGERHSVACPFFGGKKGRRETREGGEWLPLLIRLDLQGTRKGKTTQPGPFLIINRADEEEKGRKATVLSCQGSAEGKKKKGVGVLLSL